MDPQRKMLKRQESLPTKMQNGGCKQNGGGPSWASLEFHLLGISVLEKKRFETREHSFQRMTRQQTAEAVDKGGGIRKDRAVLVGSARQGAN